MNELVPIHGGTAITTAGSADIRAIVRHFMEPFRAAEQFADIVEIVRKNSTPARRSKNQRPSAAIAIHNAVAGRIDAVTNAIDRLSVVMLAPDETDIREVLAVMFASFPAAQLTPTSSHFIDLLVMELRVDAYCLASIAAACRECWRTMPSVPPISTFLETAEKHQDQLRGVMQRLGDIVDAADWAEDQIEPDKPVDEDEDDYIPIGA
jgi:hypothetical protein